MLKFDSIHKKSLPELFSCLDASEVGLNSSQLKQLNQEYGPNTIPEKKKRSVILRFSKHLANI